MFCFEQYALDYSRAHCQRIRCVCPATDTIGCARKAVAQGYLVCGSHRALGMELRKKLEHLGSNILNVIRRT